MSVATFHTLHTPLALQPRVQAAGQQLPLEQVPLWQSLPALHAPPVPCRHAPLPAAQAPLQDVPLAAQQ